MLLRSGNGGSSDDFEGGAYPCADTESDGMIVEAVVEPGRDSVCGICGKVSNERFPVRLKGDVFEVMLEVRLGNSVGGP